jgi:hypothetical protein
MQSRHSRRRLLATLSSAAGVSLIGGLNVFGQGPARNNQNSTFKERGYLRGATVCR